MLLQRFLKMKQSIKIYDIVFIFRSDRQVKQIYVRYCLNVISYQLVQNRTSWHFSWFFFQMGQVTIEMMINFHSCIQSIKRFLNQQSHPKKYQKGSHSQQKLEYYEQCRANQGQAFQKSLYLVRSNAWFVYTLYSICSFTIKNRHAL